MSSDPMRWNYTAFCLQDDPTDRMKPAPTREEVECVERLNAMLKVKEKQEDEKLDALMAICKAECERPDPFYYNPPRSDNELID